MTWFKVDDKLHSHPKWTSLPARSRALWVTAGSYSAAHMLDGFVPEVALKSLQGSRKDASMLCQRGLWSCVEGGYQFHDWGEYQPTRADIEAQRAKTAERVRNWREQREREKDQK